MRGTAQGREPSRTGYGRPALTDDEFTALMSEARAEAQRCSVGAARTGEPDFALRTQHAEFGAAAH
ncbi:hypothetical protein [Streptomyces sp. NPDC002825]|uniref:hypothetical protein n=1 Tax=Streptomyces sp. NPDC002825 TaxID=3154666 RepID=UPI003331CFA0